MNQPSILIATQNKGKLRELCELIGDLPFVICDLNAFPSIQTIPETGKTFVENASIKAVGYAKQTRLLTLADDSGLEVDALGGAPGVLSARYAHEGASDTDRTRKLLNALSGVPIRERTARFVSAIVIANQFGIVINISTGVCRGHIAQQPSGQGGFGYDPVFIPEGFDETFGGLSPELKNRISHRSRAFAAARKFLRTLTATSDAR